LGRCGSEAPELQHEVVLILREHQPHAVLCEPGHIGFQHELARAYSKWLEIDDDALTWLQRTAHRGADEQTETAQADIEYGGL